MTSSKRRKIKWKRKDENDKRTEKERLILITEFALIVSDLCGEWTRKQIDFF